jgi:hypothetical protein
MVAKSKHGKCFLCFDFSLTACQQLLLHTCDWLGLQWLRINTPGVPYGDVPLPDPAMHPQYVAVTQKILRLKFSATYALGRQWAASRALILLYLFCYKAQYPPPCLRYIPPTGYAFLSDDLPFRGFNPKDASHWFWDSRFDQSWYAKENLFVR